jgi:cyclopropane fatty-acyl-phospholipid synthase-like methyltransferase
LILYLFEPGFICSCILRLFGPPRRIAYWNLRFIWNLLFGAWDLFVEPGICFLVFVWNFFLNFGFICFLEFVIWNFPMEWFEDWFNTEEYLNVYRHRNEAEAKQLIDLILMNVHLAPGSTVLDMACGAGRHSILLAKAGFDVTAVDLSRNLLTVARQAALDAGVKVNFLRSDLRNFSIDISFDLIVNLFTSFGYFEDDAENFRIFENVYHHLKPTSYFVLDYFNRHYVEKNIVKRSVNKIPGGEIIQEREINEKRVIKKITIRKNGQEQHYHESVRMYTPNYLTREMKKIGFDIIKSFGDFNGNTFDIESSPRIIVIAKKMQNPG